ncbi:unnamed protein product [Blepharisma stoltei]|uniref:Uncharacterized protein n=1 Tax=Blepharisma stoltei TaxID=1481888 RepID=A0AAU9J110_9CILI|nr:unnamed protein product [Blepharisma stoltei]
MVDSQKILEETLNSSVARQKYLEDLNSLRGTSPEIFYKILRNLCVEGSRAQAKIKDFLEPIVVPETGLREFTQFLVNFSIGNTEHLEICFNLLGSIPYENTNLKFLLMLCHNIIGESEDFKAKFIREKRDLIRFFIEKIECKEDEFEWVYYLFSKLLPNNLGIIAEFLDGRHKIYLFEFIKSSLEEAWEQKHSLISEAQTQWFSLRLDDYSVIINEFLNSPDENFQLSLDLLNLLTREAPKYPLIKSIALNSRAILKCYDILAAGCHAAGQRALILQIIANTLENCQEAADIADSHLYDLLKSSEFDMENPMCREWVVVIVKLLVPHKPGIEVKIEALKRNERAINPNTKLI